MQSILIHNAFSVLAGPPRMYVHVVGDRIAALGEQPPPDLLRQADEVIDADGIALLPGLVNAHTHIFQTFLRGLGDDKPLLDWLRPRQWVAVCPRCRAGRGSPGRSGRCRPLPSAPAAAARPS